MKLRTTHNSIRIRVRKSEVAMLQKKNVIEEGIRFPNGVLFTFAIKIADVEYLDAALENNNLTLSIPTLVAKKWMNTNQVGIETNIAVGVEEELKILIEKDFPCLDRENEDKSDTFQELVPEKPVVC